MALSRRTGRPLERLLRGEVAEPLGLAGFGRTAWTERRGYDAAGYRVPVAWSFEGMLGAGGFSASAADLLTLGESACARDGELVWDAVQLSLVPCLPPFTAGWHRREIRPGRFVAWGCGVSGGAATFLAACPDLDLAVAGVANVTAATTIEHAGFTALIELAATGRW
jgi:CubicO group peptidase (beta-lactamase class C family)